MTLTRRGSRGSIHRDDTTTFPTHCRYHFRASDNPLQAQAEQSAPGAGEGTGNTEDLANGGGFNDDAFRYTLNVQPVIPISLNKDWNHFANDSAGHLPKGRTC